MPLLSAVYAKALGAYQAALRERQAVDFDDLEAGALDLLRQPAIAAHWQVRIEAVLVDEFQDTNHRQREIVQSLCGGEPGRLFVVGDARQNIYRFRGADVTVFTNLQEQNRRRGGLVLDLDRTFRAHASLLDAAGGLLASVMGDQPDPERPFFVPFSPLDPQRKTPRTGCLTPYVECWLGVGENSESGRQAAARALAGRLREMHHSGEIRSWDEVTLLFRASLEWLDKGTINGMQQGVVKMGY
jgi:ATP-dependent helicase/nuclease subunit A